MEMLQFKQILLVESLFRPSDHPVPVVSQGRRHIGIAWSCTTPLPLVETLSPFCDRAACGQLRVVQARQPGFLNTIK